jgi:hypothetical protein
LAKKAREVGKNKMKISGDRRDDLGQLSVLKLSPKVYGF